MGLRLSFGIGPLRASVPLTGRRRKRKRGKTYHGVVRNANGKVIAKCEHNHQTMTAAEQCGERMRKARSH